MSGSKVAKRTIGSAKPKVKLAPFGAPAALVPHESRDRPLKESDIQSRCIAWARRRGWYARKFVSPSNRSVPDYLLIKNGRVVFVEFKRPKGRPTDNQWLEITELELAGAEVHCVDFFDTRWAGLLNEEPSPRMPKWAPSQSNSIVAIGSTRRRVVGTGSVHAKVRRRKTDAGMAA